MPLTRPMCSVRPPTSICVPAAFEFQPFSEKELKGIALEAAIKLKYIKKGEENTKKYEIINQVGTFHNEWVKSSLSKESPQCYTVRDLNVSIKAISENYSPNEVISCFYGSRYDKKVYNQMQNIFLDQIEKFEGVLIATTNLLKNIDTAFSRRFDYKIEFKKPTPSERLAIWRKILPENASFEENFSVEKLAEFELSGAQIVMTMKNTALKVAVKDDGIFTFEDFANEIKREISSNFDTDKKVGLL